MKTHTVHVHGASIYSDGTEKPVDETFRVKATTEEEAIEKAELRFGKKHVDVDEWHGFILVK